MLGEYGKVAISMPVMGKLNIESEISLISIERSIEATHFARKPAV